MIYICDIFIKNNKKIELIQLTPIYIFVEYFQKGEPLYISADLHIPTVVYINHNKINNLALNEKSIGACVYLVKIFSSIKMMIFPIITPPIPPTNQNDCQSFSLPSQNFFNIFSIIL